MSSPLPHTLINHESKKIKDSQNSVKMSTTIRMFSKHRISSCSSSSILAHQVGVKAPGRPTTRIALFLAKSARLCFLGGNPKCRSTLGSWSPTDANERRQATAVDVINRIALILWRRPATTEVDSDNIILFSRRYGTFFGFSFLLLSCCIDRVSTT